ncbi:MAG: hypothetical protein Q7S40_22875, partial [Opitutaceae bacterium]|nr:hypothetical protein [Opitutaceae bacterium]
MKQFIPMLEVANHHTSRFRGRTARRLGRCALAGALMAGALEKSADAAEAGTLPPTVVVLVESKLIPPLEASLNQHQLDLEHEGYRVRRIAVEASATAHHVRALLANEWAAGK